MPLDTSSSITRSRSSRGAKSDRSVHFEPDVDITDVSRDVKRNRDDDSQRSTPRHKRSTAASTRPSDHQRPPSANSDSTIEYPPEPSASTDGVTLPVPVTPDASTHDSNETIDYPQDDLYTGNDDHVDALYSMLLTLESASPDEDGSSAKFFPVQGPWKTRIDFDMNIFTGRCYRVDKETDILNAKDMAANWAAVEAADRKELQSFITHDVFRLVKKSNLWTEALDAVWVRKRKKMPDGSVVFKSRLCIRGFLDPQRWYLPTRATTASRLSQRLLVSFAALFNWEVESLDVGSAFLQGFDFTTMTRLLRNKGYDTVDRKVVLEPPANVWRHFRTLPGSKWKVEDKDISEYLLQLVKAMYGLNDAPLAWQLCGSEFFVQDLGATQSIHDENFYIWYDDQFNPTMLGTVHVDDNGLAGPKGQLDRLHASFEARFGRIQRQCTPFTHCGVQYRRTSAGYVMDQGAFCQKLQPLSIDRSRKDDEKLTPREITMFRSQLGALLWLCVTRVDLIADIVTLQQEISCPLIRHLRQTNLVIKKAKRAHDNCGLHYNFLKPPLKIFQFTDASHATKLSSYAMEGMMTLLMQDETDTIGTGDVHLSDANVVKLNGYAHLVSFRGRKANRISYSTSHAETLACCGGKDTAHMVALRYTEVLGGKLVNTMSTISVYEKGQFIYPVDMATDCEDAYALVCGGRALPQDRA